MNQIVPHRLWLGHAYEGREYRQLFDAGIRALVEVAAEEPPSQPPRELIYQRFPLIDGGGNDSEMLYLAVESVVTLLRRRMPTLVCCSYGLSRAPAVAAVALATLYREPPEVWLQRVAEHHRSDVAPGLWNELIGMLTAGSF
jgi:hypothetical protein